MGMLRQLLFKVNPPMLHDRHARIGDLTGGVLCPVHLGKVLEAADRFNREERERRRAEKLAAQKETES